MPDREMVITALKWCIDKPCHTNCPYFSSDDPTQAYCLFNRIMPDALALLKEQEEKIESLTEDIEVWKRRYKVMVLECKSSDDPNKEPSVVKYYTTEEVEQGKAVAFPND